MKLSLSVCGAVITLVMAGFAVACSGAVATTTTTVTTSSSASPDSTSSLVTSTSEVTTVSEAATTTTELATTTTEAMTTTTAVQVTNESGTSQCLIKDVFTRDGKDYVVVDYVDVSWPPGPDGYEPTDPVITNQNPKLRTFLIPTGAELRAFMLFQALLGKAAAQKLMEKYDFYPPITLDQLKQAVAKGNINSGTEWGFWYVEVSKGRVTRLWESVDG